VARFALTIYPYSFGSCGQNGMSSDSAVSSARFASVCGMTAMAVVNRFPGIAMILIFHSTFSNMSLPALQSGHTQSSGRSSKTVPGAMPFSGSPCAGSYT